MRTIIGASKTNLTETIAMTLEEFSKTHATDRDWVAIMAAEGREPIVLTPGQAGTCHGFPATVVSHYHNGMYEIRVPGGVTCVSASDFTPT